MADADPARGSVAFAATSATAQGRAVATAQTEETWGGSAYKAMGSMWRSAKESKDWLSVWTTVWPLWDLAQYGTPLGPPLIWLRHDRAAECVEVGTFGLGGFRREFASDGTLNQGQNTEARVEHLNQWTQMIKFSRWGQDLCIIVATEGYGSQGLHKVAKKVALVSASALESLSYTLTLNSREVAPDQRERPVPAALAQRVASRISVPQYREETQMIEGAPEKVKQFAIRSIADPESGVAQERVIWVRFSEIVELHNNICSCYAMADASSLSLQSEVAKLPPKTWGPSASGHAFLEQRRHAIQGYLQKMICTPRGLRNPFLLIFLGLNAPVETGAAAGSPRKSLPAGPVPGADALANKFMKTAEAAPAPTSPKPALGMPPKAAAPRPMPKAADLFGDDDDDDQDEDDAGGLFATAVEPAEAADPFPEPAPAPEPSPQPAPAPAAVGGLFGDDDADDDEGGLFDTPDPTPAAPAPAPVPAPAPDPAPEPAPEPAPAPAEESGGLFDDDDGLFDTPAAPAPAAPEPAPTPAPTPATAVDAAQRYRCVKKSQIRAGFGMDSDKAAVMTVGDVIDVISAKVNEAGVLRVQFSGGWVSEKTAAGDLCLTAETAEEPAATAQAAVLAAAPAPAQDDAGAKAKADVLARNKSSDGKHWSLLCAVGVCIRGLPSDSWCACVTLDRMAKAQAARERAAQRKKEAAAKKAAEEAGDAADDDDAI